MKKLYQAFAIAFFIMLAQWASAQVITVTAPAPGASLFGCTSVNVTWTFSGLSGTLFNVQYSPDNGTSWVTIGSNLNAPGGSMSWTVPNISSPFFLIRVESVNNPGVFDVTDAVFTVSGALLVSSPNGGEGWATNSVQPITWAQNGASGTYRIEYSTNNGLSWTLITQQVIVGNSYNWTVPNTPSNQCLVRVSDVNDLACKYDVTNAVFSILSSITVTAPNGGQNWQATVGPQNVNQNMDNVTITANTGNFYDAGGAGANYTVGATLTKTFYPDVSTNKLQFNFTAFSLASGHQLNIYNGPSTASGLIGTYTTTSNPGQITSSHSTGALTFQFVAASGGVSSGWQSWFRSIGTPTQNISWSIVGTSGVFLLDYSTDNGTSWNSIVKGYPTATGTFPWSVPNTPSTNCLVRVTDQGNSAVVDQSNTVFTIGQATPIVISPNGGQSWYAGTNQSITWVPALFLGSTVNIEYSTDNGATWTTLSSGWPTSSGAFPWNIPNTPTTTALVRVTDAGNALSFDVSNAVFTINPYITVTTPNGGNALVGCATQNITFNNGGTSGTFNIDLTTDNGVTWTPIITNYTPGANPATYTGWQVPNINASQCRIRVMDAGDNLKVDESNTNFTISQTTNVVLITPNGGENWVAGTTQAITYTVGGGVVNVRLEYSTNNGTTWTTIVSSVNGGVYNWTIPNLPSTQCLVRATDLVTACNSDVSNATFNIVSTLTVTAPNGGQTWNATVGPQGIPYNMDNLTIFTNTANFYDNGGPAGNITNVALSKTIYPDNPLNKLRVTFDGYAIGGSGILSIYNGPSAAFPLIGQLNGTSAVPETYTSTHQTGALTFVTSGTLTGSGWNSILSSVGTPTQNISWNIVGTSGRFKIDYSTNNGVGWSTILTNYASSTGIYPWQVPNTPSSTCLVRVSDFNLGTIVDQSDATFTIGPVTPVVVVYSPNTATSFYAGTVQNITWRTGFVGCATVDIEYSTDGGTTWLAVASNVPNSASTGTYAWTVPNTPSTTCKVRVKDTCVPTTNDASDVNFTILPHVTITAPNGGGSVTGCTTQNITFNNGGTSGTFLIEYSSDNGVTWNTIISNYVPGTSTATYTGWQLPNINSTQMLVRVSDAADPLKFDVSNAVFTVNQTTNVLLLSPNGGENWVTGTTQAITYTVGGGVVNVRLEYSTNNGSTWTTIISSVNGGVYNWTVPNTPSTTCLVRATDLVTACNSDVSNATFTIVSYLTVTAPNGGETWNATVGTQGVSYNMDNVPIFTNTANFYDNGGLAGNISNVAYSKTIHPDNPLNKLRVTFDGYSIGGSGILSIYNGPSAAFPLIGQLNGTSSIPETYTSTHQSGALTFVTSGTLTGTGWNSYLQSIGTPTQNLSWNIVGTSGRYKLEYTTNNGTFWSTILTNYPSSTGIFPWQVPNTPSANCKVRVSDYNLGTIIDESNAVFTIGPVTPAVVVYTPNTAISVYAGNTTNISWRTGFVNCPTVDLEYSTNGGTSWLPIAINVPNSTSTGTYVWTVPNTPSNTCRVRVKDTCVPTTNDISDVNFTILPHITITAPNGGSTVSGCNTQNITFNNGGTSGTFLIEYSSNNGTSWNTIIANYTPGTSTATYTGWQLPNINSTQMLVRVSDAADPLKFDVSDAVFTVNQTTNVLLLSPNGGENWVTGTTQAITYTVGGGVVNVRLEYSTDNGTTWTVITSSTSGGVFNWTVPNLPSTQCLVRATDLVTACNSDVSNATFTIVSYLTVTAPNGGQSWNATVGTQGIAYNMDNVPIFTNTANFYDNGGLAGNISNVAYSKTIYPDNPLNKLRVTFDGYAIGGSGILSVYNGPTNAFPLIGQLNGTSSIPETYTSTHQTGALTFVTSGTLAGTGWNSYLQSIGTPTQNLTWSIVGTSGRYKLEYTTNNGTFWSTILTNYPSSTGVFPWQVPNTPSANCKVRVTDYGNATILDESNAVFTIGPVTPAVVVYSPNTAISVYAGSTTTISWRTGFVTCPTVDLEYSTDGGTTWLLIAANVPNSTSTGSYVWTVPNTPSTTCKVRVKDSCVPTTNDVSDVNFTINPYITITSPNGGGTVTGCNNQSITFNHGGTSGVFILEYSTDNGTTWTSIVNNFTPGANPATYSTWQLPNINSNQMLVRVTDAADPLKTDVSNAVFTVNQTTNVLVVTPNGGENWVAGTSQAITYTIGGGVVNVRLEYSTNNGTTWTVITSSTSGGVFNWTVPNLPSTQCLIRATDLVTACNSDISNANFTIVSYLTVIAPNGGENYNATVGLQGTAINMDNVPVFTNTANFYDNGGLAGNISNIAYNKTIYPDNPLNKMRVTFDGYAIGGSGILSVYNGPTNAFPLIGQLNGTSSIPETYTSTHQTGALTFVTSGTLAGTGWNSYLQSIGTPTQNLSWNIVGTSGRFKLEYTTDNGAFWYTILTNYPSTTGIFPWQVPNTPSANCKVRVTDFGNATIVDESNATFTIGPVTPVVVVYAPNTAVSFYPNTTQTISWRTGFVSCPTVDIDYSTDGGTTWLPVAINVPNSTSTGNYTWTVPNTPSTTCKIRVKDSCVPATNDVSDVNFTILPSITITSPNGGGAALAGCNTQNIVFTHGGTSGNVKIDYTTDNGTTWNLIVASFAISGNSATYTGWQLPNTNLATVKVRVMDVLDPLKVDQSDANFSVAQSSHVIVFAPNGNENWITGTTQQIQYVLSGGVATVRLEYSTNNGSTWTLITNSGTGTSFNWTIPNTPTTQALVRATDVLNSCKVDLSDSVFTITSSVAVLSPNGGEVFTPWVGPQGNTHNMDNIPITLNTGNFYDNGGPSANMSNVAYTKTFYPDYPTNKMRVTFDGYAIGGSGLLNVHNGPTTGSPLLGQLNGTSATPVTFTSTHATGALTFATSGTLAGSGWSSYLQSIGTPTQTVTWNVTGTSQRFNLEYSHDNGANWVRILTNYPSVTGSFPWSVPNTVSTQCLFKVTDNANAAIVDQSDATFTIGPPVPTLITPNGGQTYYSGQTQQVVWANTTFLNTNVILEYSTNNGSTWVMLDPNAPNTGTYNWLIPNTTVPYPFCLFRVSDVSASYLFDVSNAIFAIRPPIIITSPNGDNGTSTWQACASSSITWTAGISSSYKIELSTNNGSTWSTIAAAYANAGTSVSYPWSIPNTPSTQCLVRVTDNANATYTDVSDSTFTISPSIKLTYPNYGATIQSGSTATISWVNYNASNFYNIDYSTDGGTTWLVIVANHNTTGSTYNWVGVPANFSTNCLVRITDATASCKQDISDFPFTISASAPAITITSPNGGNTLAGCSTHTIAWTSSGTSTQFNIEYSSNAGVTWNVVATNYNTVVNTYAWTVPNISSIYCLVRVTDATASTKTDVSNATFTINTGTVASVTPAGPLAICAGSSVVLTSSSATGNLWSTGATTQTITVNAAGNYSVTVTSGSCSTTSNTVAVTVNPQPATPTISASGPLTFCAGGTVTLTSSATSGNLWLPGNQTTNQILVSSSGSYSVVVTNGNGCSSTSNPATVVVNALPTSPTAGSNSPVTQGGSINLTASTVAGATYAWTGPNGFTSTLQNPTISGATAGMAGTYSVTATAGGCSSVASTVLVNVVPSGSSATISGTIRHPNNISTIRSTTVTMTGPTTGSMVTGTNGVYSFSANAGGNYTFAPTKANDTVTNNGVTTLDLVLMQRHILQQDTLNSPYKIIAADVNLSGTVTTLDIVLTRTVILQTNLTFPNGKLWSMVPVDHVFASNFNPFPFPQTKNYPSVATASAQDYYGCKLGDVNWSWNPATAKVSTFGDLYVNFGDLEAKTGDEVIVPVRVSDFEQIAGYQFTLNWDPTVLAYIGTEGKGTQAHFGADKAQAGQLAVSWNEENGGLVTLPDGSVIFNLKFKVVGASGTTTSISASSTMLNAEAYDANLNMLRIVSGGGAFKVAGDAGAMAGGQGMSLFQNFPNPFTNTTTIRFELPETKQLRFTISDLSGQIVRSFDGIYDAGVQEVTWDGKADNGRALSSGTYILRMQAGDESKTIRMVYVRE